MTKPRNYKHEYAEYQGTPTQLKHRAERNKARREEEKKGVVRKGDGKDVDHRKMLVRGGSNRPSNWDIKTEHANRDWRKGLKGYGR